MEFSGGKERVSGVDLRGKDVWNLYSRRKTGAGDKTHKESKLRKHSQYLLMSHSFWSGLGSSVVLLLWLVLSASILKCIGTSCQLCSLHLVCSSPRRHSWGMCAEPLPCQLFWGLKEVPWALQPAKIVASFTILANMSTLWSLVAAFYNSIFKMY